MTNFLQYCTFGLILFLKNLILVNVTDTNLQSQILWTQNLVFSNLELKGGGEAWGRKAVVYQLGIGRGVSGE